VEMADGPTGCGKMARGGCLLAWNFSVTRSTVLKLSMRMSCFSDSLLAYRLKIPPAKIHAMHYTQVARSLYSCESSKWNMLLRLSGA
jgi:hypothetical protein